MCVAASAAHKRDLMRCRGYGELQRPESSGTLHQAWSQGAGHCLASGQPVLSARAGRALRLVLPSVGVLAGNGGSQAGLVAVNRRRTRTCMRKGQANRGACTAAAAVKDKEGAATEFHFGRQGRRGTARDARYLLVTGTMHSASGVCTSAHRCRVGLSLQALGSTALLLTMCGAGGTATAWPPGHGEGR